MREAEVKKVEVQPAPTDVDWREMFWEYVQIVKSDQEITLLDAKDWSTREYLAIHALLKEKGFIGP